MVLIISRCAYAMYLCYCHFCISRSKTESFRKGVVHVNSDAIIKTDKRLFQTVSRHNIFIPDCLFLILFACQKNCYTVKLNQQEVSLTCPSGTCGQLYAHKILFYWASCRKRIDVKRQLLLSQNWILNPFLFLIDGIVRTFLFT